tara:strand:+ start:358 stop:834 length:477 start_codon:yes stop_codon:yes gene_type:complete
MPKVKIAIEKDGKQYYADGDKVFEWLFERYTKYQGRKVKSKVMPYKDRVTNFFDLLGSDEEWLSDMREAFPRIDIQRELNKAKAWLLSNKAHKKDLKKFCYNWIAKANPSFNIQEDIEREKVVKRREKQVAIFNKYEDEEVADFTDVRDIFKQYKDKK